MFSEYMFHRGKSKWKFKNKFKSGGDSGEKKGIILALEEMMGNLKRELVLVRCLWSSSVWTETQIKSGS